MGNSSTGEEKRCPCRIVVVGPGNGDEALLELRHLPQDALIVATGKDLDQLDGSFREGNVILNITGNAQILSNIISEMPDLVWLHSLTAGVDHVLCPELIENSIVLTNAKGIYSSSLSEYVMSCCLYFNKDIPRLQSQKVAKQWNRYTIGELRGKTLGILGYGDIGRSCAKLGKAFGLKVVALRKHPEKTCELVDRMYGATEILTLIAESDFFVSILPLTSETLHILSDREFSACKKGSYFISIGRGAVVDEDALIRALQEGKLGGAALDVFSTEPLPVESPLWEIENLLMSPHNADMTANFRHESVKFFCNQCTLFIEGGVEKVENVVDKNLGY